MHVRPFIYCQPQRMLEDFRGEIETMILAHNRSPRSLRHTAALDAMQTAFNNSRGDIAPLSLKISHEVYA